MFIHVISYEYIHMQAQYAEQFGCLGLLIYTDPSDNRLVDGEAYPQSWWMPASGAQRGNVWNYDGDPLTMGYPATGENYPAGT